jgi:Uma2 family endonuclease
MKMVIQPKVTAEEFEASIALPENSDQLFELIDGEIVEKVPSNPYASYIAQVISFFIQQFLRERGIDGYVTAEAGGFVIDGERYAPDVAYLSVDRDSDLACKGDNQIPPDLAVEVETNTTTETERRLRRKVLHYRDAGVILWVVYPETKEVEVYTPNQPTQQLTVDDVLDGGDVLPGFKLAVKDIFRR